LLSFVMPIAGTALLTTVIPRESGVSSTPQLLGSSELLWDTGSPAFAGDDDLLCLSQNAKTDRTKHFCARGRIALSGVGLQPQGPGGGSKRTSFRWLRAL